MEYLWIKALHIIAVISWMAGLLYLPRLFVYHTQVKNGSESCDRFVVMERKLLKFIMLPAAIITTLTGLHLAMTAGLFAFGWMHAKLGAIFLLLGVHIHLAKYARDFARHANKHTEKFYRIFNEVPTILMIIIVILAIVKPF